MMEVVVTTTATRRAKLQSNQKTNKATPSFSQAGCPSCLRTKSVGALREIYTCSASDKNINSYIFTTDAYVLVLTAAGIQHTIYYSCMSLELSCQLKSRMTCFFLTHGLYLNYCRVLIKIRLLALPDVCKTLIQHITVISRLLPDQINEVF